MSQVSCNEVYTNYVRYILYLLYFPGEAIDEKDSMTKVFCIAK
jgi:hypothetical protein